MRTVLLTGATGFIGKNFIETIETFQNDISVVAFVDEKDSAGIHFLDSKGIKHINFGNLNEYKGDIDFCVHLASYGVAYDARDVCLMLDTNIKLTAVLAKFCSEHNCSLFVNTGSCFEYGSGYSDPIKEDQQLKPEDIYAASKVASESFLNVYSKMLKLKTITIRPFAVYGKYEPNHRIMPLVFWSGINHQDLALTGGNQIRDYMYASHVADAIIKILFNHQKTIDHECINISSGFAVSLKDFVLRIANVCNFDKKLFRFGQKPYRDNESMYFVGDNKRLFEIIGPCDYKLSDETIVESFIFFKEHI